MYLHNDTFIKNFNENHLIGLGITNRESKNNENIVLITDMLHHNNVDFKGDLDWENITTILKKFNVKYVKKSDEMILVGINKLILVALN